MTMARLEPIISKSQLAPEDQPIADQVVQSRGAIQGPFTMLLHCPELARHMVSIGGYIRFEGPLDMRVRVLAAMVVAREFEAIYIWGAQTRSARRQGVPESTITAIRESRSDGIPDQDRQIVDFTRTLIRKHRVDDATAEALRARFGNAQFVELTGTIGYYTMLAMTANACELEASPGAEILQV
jgi:4-carboxymuconolactone decarboxylase